MSQLVRKCFCDIQNTWNLLKLKTFVVDYNLPLDKNFENVNFNMTFSQLKFDSSTWFLANIYIYIYIFKKWWWFVNFYGMAKKALSQSNFEIHKWVQQRFCESNETKLAEFKSKSSIFWMQPERSTTLKCAETNKTIFCKVINM